MATSYEPQAAQMNEKLAPKSSLDLTLTQHSHDEDPEPRKVHACLEVDPPWTWYYHIFPNSHTLVILLQVNPTSSDEPETISKGCYKTKDISIFAWSSIPNVGHYHWLQSLIRPLPHNSKTDYLVHAIRHTLNFLQLWTITMAFPKTQHVIATPRWSLGHNPSLGLVTKIKACKVAGQEGSPKVTSGAPENAKECEGVNPHTPKWIPIVGVGVSNGLLDF